MIVTLVGDRIELVDFDEYLEIHTSLADEFRRSGLSGEVLDHAIAEALPIALQAHRGGATLQ